MSAKDGLRVVGHPNHSGPRQPSSHLSALSRSRCCSGPWCSWVVCVWSISNWRGTCRAGKQRPLLSSTWRCALWRSSATWSQVWRVLAALALVLPHLPHLLGDLRVPLQGASATSTCIITHKATRLSSASSCPHSAGRLCSSWTP